VPRGLRTIRLTELRKGITFYPELGLECDDSGGKSLDEQKRMKI
jgi:hypothetical protein